MYILSVKLKYMLKSPIKRLYIKNNESKNDDFCD
jgi:hypothetical protein